MGPRSDNPRRRTFTAQYKLDVLAEYEAAPEGTRGGILRREGLYSSHLVEWRKARDAGALSGLSRPASSRKKSPEQVELDKLRKENARLAGDLARTRTALDIMGKAHALLEDLSESAQTEHDAPAEKRSSPRSRRSS
ncbi:hypothetical protein WDZ17_17240 [Pseudokineococcus basanitobsidens]|uniref:Transposase n=1 Tax=Pseudokineococcus basanitobsidens TaxID=1926649 RepID=A0ABU8RPS4_9ACTN